MCWMKETMYTILNSLIKGITSMKTTFVSGFMNRRHSLDQFGMLLSMEINVDKALFMHLFIPIVFTCRNFNDCNVKKKKERIAGKQFNTHFHGWYLQIREGYSVPLWNIIEVSAVRRIERGLISADLSLLCCLTLSVAGRGKRHVTDDDGSMVWQK